MWDEDFLTRDFLTREPKRVPTVTGKRPAIYPDLKFEVNKEEKRISFGDQIHLTRPKFFKHHNEVLKYVDQKFTDCGSRIPREVTFTNEFGITPKNFVRVANKLLFELWIEPVQEYVYLLAMSRGGFLSQSKVVKIWEVKDKLDQCKKDGQDNLLPVVFHLKNSPKELKEHYGKGLWKKLCSNTKTRNRLLMGVQSFTGLPEPERTTFLNNLPSKVLKTGRVGMYHITQATPWILKIKPKLYAQHERSMREKDGDTKKILQREVSALHHLFEDTKHMAEQLGHRFNPEWSLAKMSQKHEDFRHELAAIQAKKDSVEIKIDAPFDGLSYRGFTAYRLKTTGSIREEGYLQNHCVGGYSDYAKDGGYVVFSVRDAEGNRHSTIGFYRNKESGVLSFNQHYMKNNDPVDKPEVNELRLEVEGQWNHAMLEKLKLKIKKVNTKGDIKC